MMPPQLMTFETCAQYWTTRLITSEKLIDTLQQRLDQEKEDGKQKDAQLMLVTSQLAQAEEKIGMIFFDNYLKNTWTINKNIFLSIANLEGRLNEPEDSIWQLTYSRIPVGQEEEVRLKINVLVCLITLIFPFLQFLSFQSTKCTDIVYLSLAICKQAKTLPKPVNAFNKMMLHHFTTRALQKCTLKGLKGSKLLDQTLLEAVLCNLFFFCDLHEIIIF
jgi:hypothetical protein